VVAAVHRHSARAGAEALARGGGAVDAVCAAAFAAAVAESPLTGPGAGGFLLARSPSGEAALMDFFVAAPGLGPRGRRLDPADLDHFTVPFGGAEQVFHIGSASVAVPGMVAGLGEAVRRHGRLSLAEVVAPAAALAREGVVLTRETGYLHEILVDMLTFTPAAAAVYAPGGRLLGPGDRLRLPELAETLLHLGDAGPASMYDGPLAGALVAHMEATGGYVTARS
jgi:gamma-glutamyltranspeptidase/glutathione hydrolase